MAMASGQKLTGFIPISNMEYIVYVLNSYPDLFRTFGKK